jgi:hypothetical protein
MMIIDFQVHTVPQGTIDMIHATEVCDAESLTSHQNSIAIKSSSGTTYIKGTSKEETARSVHQNTYSESYQYTFSFEVVTLIAVCGVAVNKLFKCIIPVHIGVLLLVSILCFMTIMFCYVRRWLDILAMYTRSSKTKHKRVPTFHGTTLPAESQVRLQSESFVLQGFLIWVTSFTLCFLDQW